MNFINIDFKRINKLFLLFAYSLNAAVARSAPQTRGKIQ